MKQDIEASDYHYTGTENLEVMSEAKRYNRFLVDKIIQYAPRSGMVVDYGAGVGTFARAVCERGREVLCVEPDAAQLAVIASLGLTGVASLAKFEHEVPYVYSLNVLEHIEDDSAAIAEIAQKLTVGGRVLIYVPAFQLLYGPMDKLVGHFRRYRRGELAQKVAGQGLKVLTCEYVDSLGFAAALVFNAMGGGGDGRLNPRAVRIYDRFVFPLSRIADTVCWAALGKNVLLVAEKS